MKKLRTIIIQVFLIYLGWLALTHIGKEKASEPELFYCSINYFVCFIPMLIYFLREEKVIPYLPLYGIFFFFNFGLAIFVNYDFYAANHVSPLVVVKCMKLATIGLASMMLAFYTPLGGIIDKISHPVHVPWDFQRIYKFSLFAGAFGFAFHLFATSYQLLPGFNALIEFMGQLSLFGIAVLFSLQLKKKLKLWAKVYLWGGLVIPRFYFHLGTGATFPVFTDITLFFIIYIYFRKKIPLVRIAIAALFFFAIFSVRNEFRSETWFGGERLASGIIAKSNYFLELVYKRAVKGEQKEERISNTYEALAIRTDSLALLALTVELTPAYIPYWNGYTYSTLLYGFVPRLIMPNKPQKNLGQQFGHRYEILLPTDTWTSINLPVVVEMYVNFGPIGIVIGMFILGLIFRALYHIFNHKGSGEGGFFISLLIFGPMVVLDSDFSLMFGGIAQNSILLYVIIRRLNLGVRRVEGDK